MKLTSNSWRAPRMIPDTWCIFNLMEEWVWKSSFNQKGELIEEELIYSVSWIHGIKRIEIERGGNFDDLGQLNISINQENISSGSRLALKFWIEILLIGPYHSPDSARNNCLNSPTARSKFIQLCLTENKRNRYHTIQLVIIFKFHVFSHPIFISRNYFR